MGGFDRLMSFYYVMQMTPLDFDIFFDCIAVFVEVILEKKKDKKILQLQVCVIEPPQFHLKKKLIVSFTSSSFHTWLLPPIFHLVRDNFKKCKMNSAIYIHSSTTSAPRILSPNTLVL
jgi:hypothetical protein